LELSHPGVAVGAEQRSDLLRVVVVIDGQSSAGLAFVGAADRALAILRVEHVVILFDGDPVAAVKHGRPRPFRIQPTPLGRPLGRPLGVGLSYSHILLAE
jgi:hypothetical protein